MLKRVLLGGLAGAIAFMFLIPVLWMLSSSIRPQIDIFRSLSPLSLSAFLPTEFTPVNFQALLSSGYPRAVLNSIIVSMTTVSGGLLLCSLAAFGLSAIKFRFREVVFAVVVISFLLPFEALAIPLSEVFRGWSLNNSYAGLILPGLANGLAIFLLRQFFLGIPDDLRDAARVDGASWWQVYWRVYMPLSIPALIGAGLILFVWQWQAYIWPLLVISDQSLDVAPVALAKYMGQFNFDFGQMFAGALIISIIPAVILLPFQRYFTQSISTTGLKDL